ncbi:hypothetical protein GIS00_20945 [Nakamurella sp. YIM 132087]|uniref:Uncharacterized protein n=1 Tax=Nakamurella alba TaxID=2665158 RepID=A0A7K1FQJ0_9ACTN|nr:hypothetical protein [Nakamurella alba]MTD16407.1 hypothetical protein [Nakamurella alba]
MSRSVVLRSVPPVLLALAVVVLLLASPWSGRGVTPAAALEPNPPDVTAAGLTGSAATYQQVPTCRMADTRSGTSLVAGTVRNFRVSGVDGFPAQGGRSGGCGIPATATSITATFTAVSAEGTGFLKAWGRGSAPPAATTMNFGAALNQSIGVVVPVTPAGLSVLSAGRPTHLVVDVTGYFAPAPYLVALSNGRVVASSRMTALQHNGTGAWTITFDRDLTGCAVAASSFSRFTASAYAEGNRVHVGTALPAQGSMWAPDAPADAYFQISLTC